MQPANVASPFTVATVRPLVHENVVAFLFVLRVMFVGARDVTVLPISSVTAMRGWGVKAAGVVAAG